MSIAMPTMIALVRAACIAALAVALVLSAGPGLRAVPRWIARLLFWATCILLLIPAMLAGYAFMPAALQGKPGSMEREGFYGLMLLERFAPVALIAAWHLPPALSPEAMHARLLAKPQTWWRRLLWFSSAWGPGLRIVFGIVFLLVFQEFELATCWNERSWTVAIFDAQAGGIPLATTLGLVALPLAAECIVLVALISTVRRSTPEMTNRFTAPRRASAIFVFVTFVTLIAAFSPLSRLLSQILTNAFIAGLTGNSAALPGGPAIWREAGNSALLSIIATLFAWLIAGWVERRGGLAWLLALPGLLGSLVVGLFVLWLMQIPPFHLLRDTPLPTVGTLALVLLPLALLLRRLGGKLTDPVAAHTALTSGSRRASWPFRGAPHVRAILLLFCFGYGDFTINALLAPPQFTSASARILNLMHYGQSDALSSRVATAFAVPLAAALLTAAAARIYARRRVR